MDNKERSARLAQLLLFGAGSEIANDLINPLSLSQFKYFRFGNNPLYQSEWEFYKPLLNYNQTNNQPCCVKIKTIVDFSGLDNTTYNRNLITKSFQKFKDTFITIEFDDITIKSSLIDYFEIKNSAIYFFINEQLLNFWRYIKWTQEELSNRRYLSNADLPLWILAMEQAVAGRVSPDLDALKTITRIKYRSKKELINKIDDACQTINRSTNRQTLLAMNNYHKPVIAYPSKLIENFI